MTRRITSTRQARQLRREAIACILFGRRMDEWFAARVAYRDARDKAVIEAWLGKRAEMKREGN